MGGVALETAQLLDREDAEGWQGRCWRFPCLRFGVSSGAVSLATYLSRPSELGTLAVFIAQMKKLK